MPSQTASQHIAETSVSNIPFDSNSCYIYTGCILNAILIAVVYSKLPNTLLQIAKNPILDKISLIPSTFDDFNHKSIAELPGNFKCSEISSHSHSEPMSLSLSSCVAQRSRSTWIFAASRSRLLCPLQLNWLDTVEYYLYYSGPTPVILDLTRVSSRSHRLCSSLFFNITVMSPIACQYGDLKVPLTLKTRSRTFKEV
jgi:hypothetical protein